MSELRKLVDAVRALDAEYAATTGARHTDGEDSAPCPACRHSALWVERMEARCALSDALLTHPEYVDVIEAVERLGRVRERELAADKLLTREPSDEHGAEWGAAHDWLETVEGEVHALADRLHAARGGGE